LEGFLEKHNFMIGVGMLKGLSRVFLIPKSKNEVLKLIENI
jgi:hypothetical protein